MSYFDEARKRARRRKSPWNFLLIPAGLIPTVLLWSGFVWIFRAIHIARFPGQDPLTGSEGFGAVLVTVIPFFAALPIGMWVGNALVWRVPAARAAFDRESELAPGTDYESAQRQLLRASTRLVPLAVALAMVGALINWHS